ncbi:hypothetical protein HK102_013788 [Quaeritorhiza haematococci]|nr:hypothetical protein HK102_013788 [Quaeritorhiza haematococci]
MSPAGSLCRARLIACRDSTAPTQTAATGTLYRRSALRRLTVSWIDWPGSRKEDMNPSYVLEGTIARIPRPARFVLPATTGSVSETYYGGLLFCGIIDFALIVLIIIIRQRETKRAGRGLKDKGTVHPNGESRPVTVAEKKHEEGDVVVENDTSDLIDVGRLVKAFKRGLNNLDVKMDFEFKELGLKLNVRKGLSRWFGGKNAGTGEKTILAGVTGEIKAGRMTAIMGPSGAGKTTFMSVLMGKVARTFGTLFVNGVEGEMHTYKKAIGYVPQEDIMHRELTVRENILHAARIRAPRTWTSKEIEAFTDDILEAFSLKGVAHTCIGDETTRGVSGGQRKRVNIAMEIAAVPLAIFLDEPTSGLDSTSALSVTHILKAISRLNLTVVSVIHQPRFEIFKEFDDLLLIVPGGRTAYVGPTSDVVPYFENLGFVFDPRANPADILMDILSGHGTTHASATPKTPQELVAAWDAYARAKSTITESKDLSATDRAAEYKDFHATFPTLMKTRGAHWHNQVFYCHNRSLVQQQRKASALALEIFVGMFAGLLMGISVQGANGELFRGVYIRPYTLISPAPAMWLVPLYGLLIGITVALAGAPAGVKVFSEEKPVYWRETAAGHSPSAYYVGKIFSSFYRLTLSALHFAAIYQFLATPVAPHFPTMFAIVLLKFFGTYGLSAIVSMIVARENASLLSVVFCLFAAVFCGYGPDLLEANEWGLIFIWEMSFNKWGTEALFSEAVSSYKHVYDMTIAANAFGYTLDRTPMDLGIMFVIGVIHRIVAFVLLIVVNRDKQR